MVHKWMIENPAFWRMVLYLESLPKEISLQKACRELKVSEDRLRRGILFLQKVGHSIQLIRKNRGTKLVPPKNRVNIQANFNLIEWLAFQAYFPLLTREGHGPIRDVLIRKLAEMEFSQREHNLFDAEMELACLGEGKANFSLEKGDNGTGKGVERENVLKRNIEVKILANVEDSDLEMDKTIELDERSGRRSEKKNKVQLELEQALLKKAPIVLKLKSTNGSLEIFPHQLIYLDGEMTLIGEDIHERCIVSIECSKLDEIMINDQYIYKTNFSRTEISDFIDALRAVSGIGIRLILKIFSLKNICFDPIAHFLGNPFMTINGEGEIIWAATIEPCETVYRWLSLVRDQVEILDPASFKENFDAYCKKNLKKVS